MKNILITIVSKVVREKANYIFSKIEKDVRNRINKLSEIILQLFMSDKKTILPIMILIQLI